MCQLRMPFLWLVIKCPQGGSQLHGHPVVCVLSLHCLTLVSAFVEVDLSLELSEPARTLYTQRGRRTGPLRLARYQ